MLRDLSDIERRAGAIADPIERLRYVRKATTEVRPTRRRMALGIAVALLPLRSDGRRRASLPMQIAPSPAKMSGFPDIWPVEQSRDFDLYSNGLRIENGLAVANQARSYVLVERESLGAGPRRSVPAGIVFHTTESDQAPFEAGQKPALKRIGKEVLLYVRNKRAYHFVIDRFGRVHRMVMESDSANHAGHSIWADERWVYLGLNESFLGVAFEARMNGDEPPVTDAQVRTARGLTDMLRSTYHIAAGNCVTHAQVSVNPSNMRIGWHTDWGGRFPFRETGLPDNYAIPNPSLELFGFEYDPAYVNASGTELRASLAAGEERMQMAAAGRGMTMWQYRAVLRRRFEKAQEKQYEQDGYKM